MHQFRLMNHKVIASLGIALLALVAGCGEKRHYTSQASNSPDWVTKGAGAFKKDGSAVFYGVGIYKGGQNPSTQRTASDTRGRDDINRVMNTFAESLSKSYSASTQAGSMDKSSDEQHVSDTIKNFAKSTINFSECIDHWRDTDGTMYALCKLDISQVKKLLDDTKELDTKMRDFVRANADKAFDEMAAESAKH